MKNILKKKKGFSLIELVIVVAIIGILALMIVPQFNDVTENSRVATFNSNCQSVVSAWAMYQAANTGKAPEKEEDFDNYINGGFPEDDKPTGAEYELIKNNTTGLYYFKATYTPQGTTTASITFIYPDNGSNT